jgi:hypothetical protein
MRRRALQALLLASGLGSVSVWVVILSMAPHARAREAANRLVDTAQELGGKGEAAASRQLVDRALALDPHNPLGARPAATPSNRAGRCLGGPPFGGRVGRKILDKA